MLLNISSHEYNLYWQYLCSFQMDKTCFMDSENKFWRQPFWKIFQIKSMVLKVLNQSVCLTWRLDKVLHYAVTCWSLWILQWFSLIHNGGAVRVGLLFPITLLKLISDSSYLLQLQSSGEGVQFCTFQFTFECNFPKEISNKNPKNALSPII